MEEKNKFNIVVEILIILLAFAGVFLFLFEMAKDLTPEEIAAVRYADLFIALFFLSEFSARLYASSERKQFLKYNWWQLAASIPVTAVGTQALRGLMLLRLINVVRFMSVGARASIALSPVYQFMRQTYLGVILFFLAFLAAGGTFSFYLAEFGYNRNVNSLSDSLWWVISTMTTTGVATEPVTLLGRIIGMILMVSGVSSFSVFAAALASYFIRKSN